MNDFLTTSEILDHSVVEALFELGGEDDPELLSDLVELFRTDASQRIAAMQKAVGETDWSTVEGMAHSLKSTAANLGAMAMSDLCRETEFAAREGRNRDAASFTQQIPGAYQQAWEQLVDVVTPVSHSDEP